MLASEDVLKLCVQGFKSRELFNHCPHEEGTSAGTIKRELPLKDPFVELELNEAQCMGAHVAWRYHAPW